MNKSVLMFFVLLLTLSSVSALTVVNGSVIEVNKTIGVDATFEFTIMNDVDLSPFHLFCNPLLKILTLDLNCNYILHLDIP